MARSRTSFVRGPKRHGDWVGSVPQTVLATVAGSASLLDQSFTPVGAGETVIRTRGLFGFKSDQIGANEDIMGAVGIGIVSAQAVSVGITAVPHPDTDSGWNGWLWHSYFASSLAFGTAVGFIGDNLRLITIDSKAMRKVGDEERVVVVIQNSSTTGLSFYNSIRIYSKPF